MNGQIPVTPHSVVAVIPTLKMSFVQAFYMPEEINRAEAITVLRLGLQWAASEFQECHFSVWCDNAAEVATLTKGSGALWRHHDLRCLHLTTLHGLRNNTFEIQHISSANNLAVLQTLPAQDSQRLKSAHRGRSK